MIRRTECYYLPFTENSDNSGNYFLENTSTQRNLLFFQNNCTDTGLVWSNSLFSFVRIVKKQINFLLQVNIFLRNKYHSGLEKGLWMGRIRLIAESFLDGIQRSCSIDWFRNAESQNSGRPGSNLQVLPS